MGRWEPNASGRLREAAMELFAERGYEQTTVGEIAERAGLSARTFFRHYADKREVLFAGSEVLQERLAEAVEAAPEPLSPMGAVAAALDAFAELLGGDHDFSRRRQAVVAANAELRERELNKLATLAAVLGEALRRRGVGATEAALAAETGIAILRVAFAQWVAGPGERELREVMRESLEHLATLAAGYR
jgi:AcrR family transcriptional regulator